MDDSSEILKKIRRIEIKTRMLSNQVFAGEYHSAFKGKGMTFSEVREYQYGDDVRNIDWNVTARFNHPFIKIYEEERELTVMLLIDISGSGLFGTDTRSKKNLLLELSAVLAFSAMLNNDKIGAVFFAEKVERYIPPKKGRTHVLRILREMIDIRPTVDGTNIAGALQFFTNTTKKRSTAFLMSDFIDNQFDNALRIASGKHDMVALRVFDSRETRLPDMGLVCFRESESGKQVWLDTSSVKVRNTYTEYWSRQDKYLKDTLRKAGVDLVNLNTNEDYVKPLINLFKRRGNA
jgi:uncharacterized protein (DUF58 family)